MNVGEQRETGDASMLTPAACQWLDEQWGSWRLIRTRIKLPLPGLGGQQQLDVNFGQAGDWKFSKDLSKLKIVEDRTERCPEPHHRSVPSR